MRRSGPRPLAATLRRITREAGPATLLARVQESWPAVVGPIVAAEAEPVAERAGAVTVACRSSVWAHELELLGPDMVQRLNDALEPGGRGPLEELRFRTAGGVSDGPTGPGEGFP